MPPGPSRESRLVEHCEAIAVDGNGLSAFDLIRYRRQDDAVTPCAFDLLELDGDDLLRGRIEQRKSALA
jgi:ATP-dependent DNA ligase